MSEKEKCHVCGNIVKILPSESLRETLCPVCRSGKRNRDLAKVIVGKFAQSSLSLSEAVEKLKDKYIYESQCSGSIHNILKNLPNYTCSEYFDGVPLGSRNRMGIRCEDLQNLTFQSNTFDLIITQDVLEHVVQPKKAFSEINRVLKVGGLHIFTVPVHESRKTIRRAELDPQGNLVYLLQKVYHGDPLREEGTLVYTDFGEDLIDFLKSVGIPTEIACYTKLYDAGKIPNVDLKEEYELYNKCYQEKNLLKYFKYNSIVLCSKKSNFGNIETKYSEERMFPEEPNDMPLAFVYLWLKQYEEHVARYNFFAEYAKNNCVLDAGCGFGYGSAILLNHQPEKVVGIDKSSQALRYAKEKYNLNNIYYTLSDVTCTPFAQKTFDTIYAFEIIEHIKYDDAFLSEMVRILKDDGSIFISTPNKKLSGYEDGSRKNQFHIREYELQEFSNLLSRYFSHVQIYGERFSQRYGISESNLNSLKAMREKIMELEQQNIAKDFEIDRLNKKINHLEKKFDKLHIEFAKRFIPARFLRKKSNGFENKAENRFPEIRQIEPLISIAPLQHEIIINKENLNKALYFIGVCKK